MQKVNKNKKYFIADTSYSPEFTGVFDSLEEVKDRIDEIKEATDEDFVNDNIEVYCLDNAVKMTVSFSETIIK